MIAVIDGENGMAENETRLREALEQIAETARMAVAGDPPDRGDGEPEGTCTLKSLPARLLVHAAQTAITINPVNAPVLGPLAVAGVHPSIADPLHLAVVTAKYWGATPRQLTVSFLENTPADLRARVLSHMNAWGRTVCIGFIQTQQRGQVRISRGSGGYWSYLGTDILHIPANRPTMNLQGFTMDTPDSEFVRVVRHETGHTLGFPHEHMRRDLVARVDPVKAYAYFWSTQGWDKQTVDQQVLTALDETSLMSTPADQTSIMCYQLPGSITKDGRPILGGVDIGQTDYTFAGRIYPKPAQEQLPGGPMECEDQWGESEDVPVTA